MTTVRPCARICSPIMESSRLLPALPLGVVPIANSSPKPVHTPPGTVCVWLTHFSDSDRNPKSQSEIASVPPREGYPLYVHEDATMDQVLFSARDVPDFRHTDSVSFRLVSHGKYRCTSFATKSNAISIRQMIEKCNQSPDDMVVFCHTNRYDASQVTKRFARLLGLDYEKEYSFMYDTRTCARFGSHHYLAFHSPELDNRGCYLLAEMRPNRLGFNKYTFEVINTRNSNRRSRVAHAHAKISLKHLDATFAHVVEKYPAYSFRNINCQFFCDKSAKLLGFQKTLRAKWCDNVLRTFGCSEASIRQRHERAAARTPRCPEEKIGKRVRRWLLTRIAMWRRPNRYRSAERP